MLQKYKVRSKAEKALVEFLMSLRFFAVEGKWRRAQMYAHMLGLTGDAWISGINMDTTGVASNSELS
jgi:hypothetical protein